jgi:hypothetical protein
MSVIAVRSATLAIAVLLAAVAAPAARAQGANLGPFDPKSGRFAAAMPDGPARAADTLAAPAARAWVTLAKVYADLGIPISVVDTETHVLGALRATHRRPVGGERLSRVLECGTGSFGPNAERYTVKLTALSSIQPLADGRATLDTRVGGVAAPNGLSSSVACASTGLLEERIAAELRKLLGS